MASPNKTLFNRTRLYWLVLVSINSGVPIATVWKYHAGETSSRVALVSGMIVLIVCNLAALLAFWRRYQLDGEPLPRTLLVGAAALAVVCCLLTILGVSSVRHHNEYADLAFSDTPLSSIEPEQKRLVVELIRCTAANSQEENKALAEAQKVPMNPPVYSPESFANQQVIQSTMAHLTKYADIDFQYFGKQQSAREDFRRKMAVIDPEYLKSWNAKRQEQEAADKATDQLEHDWFASVESLYNYAAQHTQEISVKDGRIAPSANAIRQAFNDQLDWSKALHDKLQSSVKEQVRRQQESRAQLAAE